MTPAARAAGPVRRRYLALLAVRWLPVGLIIPVSVLIVTQRGLSIAEFGLASAAQGLIVLLLELPTGGLADAIGRRPVLVAATLIDMAALTLFLTADSVGLLVVVYACKGVSRALDSGPLDAWFVDASLAADPDDRFETTLAHGTAVLSGAIAVGALLSGALVALGDLGPIDALSTPVVAAIAIDAVAVVALSAWMVEPRRARGRAVWAADVRAVRANIRAALGIVRASSVLLALTGAEALWSFGMISFEVLMGPKLAEVTGDARHAGAILGPVTSAAWVAAALGAAAVPWLVRRSGAAVTGAVLRVAQGLSVLGMAVAGGALGLVVAYTLTYAVHGASNPVHQGLLHRQVEGPQRTTVISVNSMVGMPAGALGGVLLGWLADAAGLGVAMAAGALALAAAAPLYLVRARTPAVAATV